MTFAAALSIGNFGPALALVAVTTLVMLRLRERQRRAMQKMQAGSPLTKPASRGAAQRPPPAAERWEAELYDYCREVEGRLDTKIAALQQLILDADARIAHLESLGLDEPSRPATSESLAGPHFSDPQVRKAAIYAMADAGRHIAEIANRLQTPLAEVEATLRLRTPHG